MTRHAPEFVRPAAAAVLAATLLAVPAASANDEDVHRTRTRTHVVESGEDGRRSSVEVVIENGDVTVKMDGKVIPQGNVIREDGKIVIRDADGNEIHAMRVEVDPGHLMDFRFGAGGENRVWVSGDGEPAAAPAPAVMLGIQLGSPGPALEHHLGLEPGTSTIIVGLYEGLPAHAAGLGEHDVIVRIDGASADPGSLRTALAERQPGDVAHLEVIQRGERREVDVELAAYDREAMAEAKLIGAGVRTATAFFGEPTFLRAGENAWFGEAPGVDPGRVFVDDADRVFEFAPDALFRFERAPAPSAEPPAQPEDDALDGRLRRLDRRLADLQRALDALVEEARRQKED